MAPNSMPDLRSTECEVEVARTRSRPGVTGSFADYCS